MKLSQSLVEYVEASSRPQVETPCYVYSEAVLRELKNNFDSELAKHSFPIPLRWHYAMKANALPELLKFFRNEGAGIDLVSGGELQEALSVGFQGKDLVFSGIGKKDSEIREALKQNVLMLNVESESELNRIERIAGEMKIQAKFSLRVNPDVDAKTHPYISTGMWEHKFGLPFDQARDLYVRGMKSKNLIPLGLSLHIGSQIFDMAVLEEAVQKTIAFAQELKGLGVTLELLDVGGGLGVDYKLPNDFPNFEGYAAFLFKAATQWSDLTAKKGSLVFECGRAFTAQSGFLLSEVIAIKKSLKKNFLIIDASMTELLRPALYKAEHPVFFVEKSKSRSSEIVKNLKWEVVGPVCESSDVLAKEITLAEICEGDLLVLGCAGAYGAVMSQTYNARPLPQEWWIDTNKQWKLVNKSKPRRFAS